MAWPTEKDVARRFRERPMSGPEAFGYEEILHHADVLGNVIRGNTPGSSDQWAALRKIREACDAARNAIVCSEPPPDEALNAYLAKELVEPR
jgi:hypothetical protein